MSVAIKIENLSKQYRLGLVSTRTLSHDLNRWWQTSILGREDPYLKIGEENKLTTRQAPEAGRRTTDDYVWALKDINLEVEEGEVLGVIGKNGAGKSTLLKILSKVTTPTTGIIKLSGRIASLLEVGTGFHLEMTGRENIFMNGAIMGMTKSEICMKFDEIVDFAGVERYIDTPVKRYSSGMIVRLGFAVAAHLEPEILVVDEVLAVGDAEFQKKAVGKMQEVSKGKGRTVFFVSHNMASIQKLCNVSLLLEQGKLTYFGKTNDVINFYLKQANNSFSEYTINQVNTITKIAYITKLRIEALDGKQINEVPIGKPWRVKVFFTVNQSVNSLIIGLGMVNMYEIPIRTSWNSSTRLEKGNYIAVFEEDKILFTPGRYRLIIGLSKAKKEVIEYLDDNFWITFSDVLEDHSLEVLSFDSGLLINQMKMYVEQIN